MMDSLKIATLLLLLSNFCFCAKLPSSFRKCDRNKKDFNQCLSKAVEDAVRQLTKPIKELGLPSMEPLEVPSLVIGAGSGAVAFEQNYQNTSVSGYGKMSCSKAEMNFETKTFYVHCTFPEVKMEFKYEISGRILLLPIYGKGPGAITLERVETDLTFKLDEYDKKGVKYFKVANVTLVMDPQLIRFKLENLFDGDEALGRNINSVLNDNWKEVFADVKPSYEDAFGKIYFSIFNNVLSKVPVNELFGDT
ncbi:JHBP domain containing protein [Asbolus verrucosus]|uniref:JHBP domain containing protein n=1 Tax=Asbolus verrucosus TaxID=1661398 RepID=A0A482VE66_ASBVE|nr:JHBP domain containing protein [Asbolus verrucosus]